MRILSSLVVILSLGLLAGGCSSQNDRLTGPSGVGRMAQTPLAPPAKADGTTLVDFESFDTNTLTVTVKTTTTSAVGQPYIDEGKIHLQILVDQTTGDPVSCNSPGSIWVRLDQSGSGLDVTSAMSYYNVDLDGLRSLNIETDQGSGVFVQDASCGDTICIQAQYITGGGNPKVGTHFANPTPFYIDCGTCAYTQGYWKTHGPSPTGNNSNEWPVTSLMLGSVTYTDVELQLIFNEPVGGNGLISLAHQLIAAKLNVANGAGDGAIASTIAEADALIDGLVVPPVGTAWLAPATTGALVNTLTQYNEGVIGPGSCDDLEGESKPTGDVNVFTRIPGSD